MLPKDMPPQPGDDKPVNPKNPAGVHWSELFGRKPDRRHHLTVDELVAVFLGRDDQAFEMVADSHPDEAFQIAVRVVEADLGSVGWDAKTLKQAVKQIQDS